MNSRGLLVCPNGEKPCVPSGKARTYHFVPFPSLSNPATVLTAQPLAPGSTTTSGISTGHADGQICVWYGLLDPQVGTCSRPRPRSHARASVPAPTPMFTLVRPPCIGWPL